MLLPFLFLSGYASASLRICVEGEGYLRFNKEGRAVYAKSAAIEVIGGELKHASGVSLLPPIKIASALNSISVSPEGWVLAGESKFARLLLAKFLTEPQPEGAFLVSQGRAQLGYPGSEGFGKVVVEDSRDQGTKGPRDQGTQGHGAWKGVEGRRKESEDAGRRNTATPQYRITAIPNHIAIPATAQVAGPAFTLGEIAEITGPDAERLKGISLGNSPVHGVPMPYSRERLSAKLSAAGFDSKRATLEMGPTVEVRRAGQTIAPTQLLEAAKGAVLKKLGLQGDLTCDDKLAEMQLPNGALEIVPEAVAIGSGSATVTLGVRVEGKRIIGRTLRLKGEILEPAVSVGATVRVQFISNGVAIELPGRVRSAGAIGQTVEVAVSGLEGAQTTTHTGVVKAKGLVEVRL